MTPRAEELTRLIVVVGDALEANRDATPPFDMANYTAWREASDAANEQMKTTLVEAAGAVFTHRAAHDHVVKIAGIRASSTGGWTGALENWRRAAAKRIGGAA